MKNFIETKFSRVKHQLWYRDKKKFLETPYLFLSKNEVRQYKLPTEWNFVHQYFHKFQYIRKKILKL